MNEVLFGLLDATRNTGSRGNRAAHDSHGRSGCRNHRGIARQVSQSRQGRCLAAARMGVVRTTTHHHVNRQCRGSQNSNQPVHATPRLRPNRHRQRNPTIFTRSACPLLSAAFSRLVSQRLSIIVVCVACKSQPALSPLLRALLGGLRGLKAIAQKVSFDCHPRCAEITEGIQVRKVRLEIGPLGSQQHQIAELPLAVA